MPRPFVVGIDCKLYLNTDRATNPPTSPWDPLNNANYTEIESTRDLTLNLGTSTSDATSRGGNGWRQNIVALLEGGATTNILWLPDDTVFQTMLTAYINKCPVDYLILDGPKEGIATANACGDTGLVSGLYADLTVTDFSRNENMEEVVTADVTLEVGRGIIPPTWLFDVTQSGGIPA